MTTEQITKQTMTMTRAQLEAEHVSGGVSRWGEGERAGLQRQAAAKSLATLRADHWVRIAEADGIDESAIRTEMPDFGDGRMTLYPASGALDDVIS